MNQLLMTSINYSGEYRYSYYNKGSTGTDTMIPQYTHKTEIQKEIVM